MDAAEALVKLRSLQRTFAIGIIFHHGRGEHLTESNGEPFGNGGDVFHNRHESSLAVAGDWGLVAPGFGKHHKKHKWRTKVAEQRFFFLLPVKTRRGKNCPTPGI